MVHRGQTSTYNKHTVLTSSKQTSWRCAAQRPPLEADHPPQLESQWEHTLFMRLMGWISCRKPGLRVILWHLEATKNQITWAEWACLSPMDDHPATGSNGPRTTLISVEENSLSCWVLFCSTSKAADGWCVPTHTYCPPSLSVKY